MTGATPDQIEAAAERYFTCCPDEQARQAMRDRMSYFARHLVPPDHRIIGPDDVDAIRNVLIAHKAAIAALNALWEGTAASADNHDDRRLTALIGDADAVG